MKKIYCHVELKSGGFGVFEYTHKGEFVYHSTCATKEEADDLITKLST